MEEQLPDGTGTAARVDADSVSALLVELWRDYKSSHLPSLVYSVAFVSGVLTVGNGSELFRRVSEEGRVLIAVAVGLCIASAGMAMIHRFTSQLFMEIETLPADRAMRAYFRARALTYRKITYSYGYGLPLVELFKLLHTLTKYLTGLFLYIAWAFFGLAMMLAFLRPRYCAATADTALAAKSARCFQDESGFAMFLEWLVGWLARDVPIAAVLCAIAAAFALGLCPLLRQPKPLRVERDRFGPIAWPLLFICTIGLLAIGLCYWQSLALLGYHFRAHPVSSAMLAALFAVGCVISACALRLRFKRFSGELPEYDPVSAPAPSAASGAA